ncbi:MAG: hypothetical protein J7L95_02725, partial [Prolixibacteraceae bacterium]|nr:hypothetical protein [Prolixibacteraceae bacterium]
MSQKKKKRHFKKRSTRTFNKKKLKNSILSALYKEPGKTVNYKQISTWLGIQDQETRKLVNVVLQELKDDDYL